MYRADIPRSRFNVQTSHKTTFDAGKLIPIYVDEVLPGDTFSLSCTAFGRMATPIFPIMDNLHMDTFFFFVPYRLLWDNWKRFMGEQRNPGDSTSFLVPQVDSPVGGWPIGDICDKLLDEEEIAAADEMSYHLYAGEWIHDGNHINWKAVIETGETDPETGEPITRPITDKDKRPETAMEWVSGSSYGTPPPDGSVMPQYKRSLLDAWDIWADWDASIRNNWGTSQESMEDANRAEADGRITTFSNGAVGSTYTEWAYLKGTNAGGDIEWPPFVSGDNAYTITYTSDYSWSHTAARYFNFAWCWLS